MGFSDCLDPLAGLLRVGLKNAAVAGRIGVVDATAASEETEQPRVPPNWRDLYIYLQTDMPKFRNCTEQSAIY